MSPVSSASFSVSTVAYHPFLALFQKNHGVKIENSSLRGDYLIRFYPSIPVVNLNGKKLSLVNDNEVEVSWRF